MTTGQRRSSIREQFREDVKSVALRQLTEGGAPAISLNAIAKEIGISTPALYRYYANRDALLTALVIDAYHDLRDALARDVATHASPRQSRIHDLCHAYRRWAREHPHRYELLFRPPLPGYDAHAEPISQAAETLMDVVLGILVDDGGNARDHRPEAVRLWSRLHGFVSLEIGGAWGATNVDADALFDAEVRALTSSRPGQTG